MVFAPAEKLAACHSRFDGVARSCIARHARHEAKRDKHRAFEDVHARRAAGMHQLAAARFGMTATDWQTHALPSFTWKQRCDARPP